ncbi:hypothetical protein XENOCAPTIV_011088 [Xenoophorus captivus]|uniref:ANK_REP_REGION domain-containing protein n=1 Tax=Xenoophorus captivus TaxID=1517983 RepID=A0ABV0QAD1_9TELE
MAIRLGCVEVLLESRAAVDSVAAEGQTSLFLACEAGRLDCAQALLNAGANRSLTTTECLEVLCNHSEQDIERRDKCNRTIHDVATDDCKDLLENLGECLSSG